MMWVTNMEEILRLNEKYSPVHAQECSELMDMLAGYDKLLVMEHAQKGIAAVGIWLTETDVTCGSMWCGYFNEEEVLDTFITFAEERYVGKKLHVSARWDESFVYDVLRYHDFIVDKVETAQDEDEEESEWITCSKQL